MPYSLPGSLSAIAEQIYTRQPKRLLDLGVGSGLFGCIARQYLDGIHGRCRPDQWQAEIVGIEAWTEYGHISSPCPSCHGTGFTTPFSDADECPACGGARCAPPMYRNPMWDCYTAIIAGDFCDPEIASFEGGLAGWDMVLMIDSLEHLEPAVGREFLRQLVAHNQSVIVSVPMGISEQGAVGGNEFERHRTTFNSGESEFAEYARHIIHRGYSWTFAIEGAMVTA